MSALIYQVHVGEPSKLYDHCIGSVADYCSAHGIEHIVQREPILKIRPNPERTGRSREAVERLGYLPIYEKENALAYLGKYDQVAVIDADVWIRPGSPNVFDHLTASYDFAGVLERDLPMTDKYRDKLHGYCRGQYARIQDASWDWQAGIPDFFNMGVMLLNLGFLRGAEIDFTPRAFLERPEFQRFVDGVGQWKWSTDQTLLNYWIKVQELRVKHLDWRWNALYSALRPGMIEHAYFVHFFLRDYLPHRGERPEELGV